MTQDDPFFNPGDDTRTILKPSPGGSLAGQPPASPPQRRASPYAPDREEAFSATVGMGLNPLEAAASSLITVASRLRSTPSHSDPDGLRNQLIDEIKAFEARARSQGIRPQTVLWARYVLCTVLDEVVLSTPWGSTSLWLTHSLLNTFHNDTQGGEKFFVLLKQAAQDPAGNLHLLELMYICLSMGFKGRYGVIERGHDQLEALRERLFHTIRTQRGDFERELSPCWQGIKDQRNPVIRYVPLWVVGAAAGVLLLVIYLGFSFSLNRTSDPVFTELHSIKVDKNLLEARPVLRAVSPPPAKPRITLRMLLEPEINARKLDVDEAPDKTIVTVRGKGLFGSGSAQLNSDYLDLFLRIGEALDEVPGRILVSGHTDNIPIRSLRFPSNWHLSQERANAVKSVLSAHIDSPERVTAEGRADTEPLVPNDSSANRARNRRVEIALLPTREGR